MIFMTVMIFMSHEKAWRSSKSCLIFWFLISVNEYENKKQTSLCDPGRPVIDYEYFFVLFLPRIPPYETVFFMACYMKFMIMECEAFTTNDKWIDTEMLGLGDDPLRMILSFCDLPTISRVAQTNHPLHCLVEQEWCWRDAHYYRMDQKSRRANTARPIQQCSSSSSNLAHSSFDNNG